MFADSMSIGTKFVNSIGLTILGMGIVFAVLIILSFALDLLRVIAGDGKKKDTPSQEVAQKDTVVTSNEIVKQEDDGELIAVIAAAISAMSGTSVDDIVVRSIKPLPQKQSIWSGTGRQEQMLDRL
ncbi:OadG family protein [Irregularibacter muris]|uniref:OadG family protein n=1 Tax=Irregularibacter muris TaxID=1796619 RepID=A0AAE3KZD6_9FIRM|nr:OadG family protein [Irregularibacter muris]MCR1899055.1 OadG family protein [Irregularibacter muris]